MFLLVLKELLFHYRKLLERMLSKYDGERNNFSFVSYGRNKSRNSRFLEAIANFLKNLRFLFNSMDVYV